MSPATRSSGLAQLTGLGGARGPGRRRRRSGRGLHRSGRRLATVRAAGGFVLPAAGILVVAAVVFGAVQWLRPAPRAQVRAVTTSFTLAGKPALPWPSQGEAALAVAGAGVVGSSGSTAPVPIASIAKVMTALLILRDHPLAPGQSGPLLTITPADVTQYQTDVSEQQSVVAVVAGEQLTELQALQALLIPSANNIAHVLATWDSGSTAAFVVAMNNEAATLGLTHTHFVSPSGFASGSVSTPEDLIRLGQVAMANPVFASVVGMPAVTLPVAGTLQNYDYNLGHGGFVGIKTGSDGHAGGCFLFEAKVAVAGGTATIDGAVLGQQAAPIIQSALNASSTLVQALAPQLADRQLIRRGEQVAQVVTPWGARTTVVATQALTALAWPGLDLKGHLHLDRIGSTLRRGQRVGTLDVDVAGTTHAIPVVTTGAVHGPGLGFKLGNI